MSYQDFPKNLYVRVLELNQPIYVPELNHPCIEDASHSRERTQVAEYVLNRVVETKMVAEIQCEIG